MLKLLILAVVLVSCHGNDTEIKTDILGNFNKYFVYTRETGRQFYELNHTNASITASPINFDRDTAIIIHGHQGTGFTSLNPVVKDAFLRAHNLNVIVLDWSIYAQQSYNIAVGAVPRVGLIIADLVTRLVEAKVVELHRLHIVGFNLGAHIAGYVGRSLGGQVARITGLDPAKNQWGNNSRRLTLTDARYVEVIHTDRDGLMSNGLGTAIGHVDFYPNGGGNQPGCMLSNSCSHNRAWELFAATLLHDHLVANRCANTLQLNMNLCRGYTLHMGNNDYFKYGNRILCYVIPNTDFIDDTQLETNNSVADVKRTTYDVKHGQIAVIKT